MLQISILQVKKSHTPLAFSVCAVQRKHSLFLPYQTEIYAKSEEDFLKIENKSKEDVVDLKGFPSGQESPWSSDLTGNF